MWFQRRCVKLSVCARKATEKPGLINPPRVRANGLESLITQGRFLSKLIHQDVMCDFKIMAKKTSNQCSAVRKTRILELSLRQGVSRNPVYRKNISTNFFERVLRLPVCLARF